MNFRPLEPHSSALPNCATPSYAEAVFLASDCYYITLRGENQAVYGPRRKNFYKGLTKGGLACIIIGTTSVKYLSVTLVGVTSGMYRLRRGGTFGEKQVAGSAALKTQNSINANNYNAAPAAIAA